MRRAGLIAVLGSIGLAPCARGGPDGDLAAAYQAELLAERALRAQEQGAGGPQIFGGLQMWYVADLRSEAPGDDEDLTIGFVMRRVKLGVQERTGDWEYRINAQFSRGVDFMFLEDAWIGYNAGGNILIRAGQFKLPYLWEESVEWYNQLAAERSPTADFFSQHYSQGIEFVWDPPENYRGRFAVSDGVRTSNTEFNSFTENDIAFTGRLDWMPRGNWELIEDFTSESSGAEALRFGVAAHFQTAGRTGGGSPRSELRSAAVDAQWERSGWSLYAAVNVQDGELKDQGVHVTDAGVVAQAGYRYDERNEVFGRIDSLIPEERPSGSDPQVVFTAGYNRYFDLPGARFTADIMYFVTEVNQSLAGGDTGQGFLPDDGSPQIVLRLAVQFIF